MNTSNHEFDNTTAIVFAASRGIGRSIALKLGAAGANVVVNYQSNKTAADDVVKQIEEMGGNAFAHKADVSSKAEVEQVFSETAAQYNKVDIVINAAGAAAFGPTDSFADGDLNKLIAVNVVGAFNVLSEAAQKVTEGGSILQFSTGGTKMSVPGGGVYAGTKSAGELMALGLAKEIGHKGVNVNVISPGVTDTDGLVMPDEQIHMLIAQTPLGRLGQPHDVADAAVFLVSEKGSWISGQNIQANGGIL